MLRQNIYPPLYLLRGGEQTRVNVRLTSNYLSRIIVYKVYISLLKLDLLSVRSVLLIWTLYLGIIVWLNPRIWPFNEYLWNDQVQEFGSTRLKQ